MTTQVLAPSTRISSGVPRRSKFQNDLGRIGMIGSSALEHINLWLYFPIKSEFPPARRTVIRAIVVSFFDDCWFSQHHKFPA
jgi:hypothetical protein